MPEKTRKCLKSLRKCRHKPQTTMPFTQSFVRSQTKKNVIAHEDCQEFSFLYQCTLKQMKQKRSSGNISHLLLQLSILLHQVSKKHCRTLHWMKKKWRCARRYSKQKRRNFENQKMPFAAAKK